MRIATFNTDLFARGPGLMLRDILEDAPRPQAVARMIAEAAPDILVLQGVDYDAGAATLNALADTATDAGAPGYPYRFALPPNSGRATGLDLDGDGRLGGPRDAMGYGRFAGQGGMAVLSRFPIDARAATDLSDLLWDDLPGAIPPDAPFPDPETAAQRRLSSTGHWIVPITVEDSVLHLMTWSATPPVFDGPEDLNGRRAHDETALWLRLLDGALDVPAPPAPFVILGLGNIDPMDGEGRAEAVNALLDDPRVQDSAPRSAGGMAAADPDHRGDPSLDTADLDGPGNLRLSVLLPSTDITVRDAGVLWPAPGTPLAADLGPAEDWPRHRLVWADITLP
ncbi:endonuclease/exonuclease/phosphatase family protein [Palleronia pelagia]|uniref:Endonuclease/Exonuclease/phosphatase family protein n=1 Tax=Palleronia pelagia TaxID=387096 RepID=A0A1H8F9G9_9RHOB|nr:endonuclease/exonuclease/phosphatase family protein [Palleronia pelagia]SEN28473.1 Endonuclease/Exonuclease/phosphatase family protein [Palleronia pelagia]